MNIRFFCNLRIFFVFVGLIFFLSAPYSQTIRVLPNLKWWEGTRLPGSTAQPLVWNSSAEALQFAMARGSGTNGVVITTAVGNFYTCSGNPHPILTTLLTYPNESILSYINGQLQFSATLTPADPNVVGAYQLNGTPTMYCTDFFYNRPPDYNTDGGWLCPTSPNGPCGETLVIEPLVQCPDGFQPMSPNVIPSTAVTGSQGVYSSGYAPLSNLILYCEGYTPPNPCDCELN